MEKTRLEDLSGISDMASKKNFYNKINAPDLSGDDMRRVEKMLDSVSGLKISQMIDMGGNPSMTEIISKRLNCQALCVNISSKTILANPTKCVKVVFGDVESIEIRKKFDLVVCAEVLEHLKDVDFFIGKVKKMLNPGGYLLLTVPNLSSLFNRISLFFGWQPRGINPSGKITFNPFAPYDYNWGHISMFTSDSIKKFLRSNGFKIIKFSGTCGGHTGENRIKKAVRRIMSAKASFSEQIILLARIDAMGD